MANLVQVAEELEYVPKDQLIEYSQNPDSRYPQYLVLSEIQRRTQMERMYNAQEASMNKPTTTVAEEVVSDFAQPQGLGGMNVNGSANADAFSPQAGMPAAPMQMPAAPMQMAASGGRTGYYPGGTFDAMNQSMQTSKSRQGLLSSLDIDPRTMTGNQIQQSMLGLGGGPSKERGVRNNNPLNIKYNPNNDWLGQVGSDDDGFAIFKDIDHGYRAGNQILETYGEDHGIDTISGVINRFAPAADDNDTDSYSDFVSSRMGIGADDKIDLSNSDIREELATTMASLETPSLGLSGRKRLFGDSPTSISADAMNQSMQASMSGQGDDEPITDPEDKGLGDWVKENPGKAALAAANIASTALMFVPGLGTVVGGALKGALLLVPKGLTAAKTIYQAKKAKILMDQGRKQLIKKGSSTPYTTKSLFSEPSKISNVGIGGTASYNPNVVLQAGREAIKGMKIPTRVLGGTAGLGTGYMLLDSDSPFAIDPRDETDDTVLEEIHPKIRKRTIINKVDELTQDPKSGLGGKMKSYLDQVDGLDIAKLGGIVMGARNMSELGQGITALASDIQTRRKDEKTEDRLAALSDLQGGLYEQQTKQIKAEIAAMPADRLDALLKQYGDYAEAIEEGMVDISDDAKNSFWLEYRQLLDSAAEKEGYKFKSQAESDEEAMDYGTIK